MSVSSDSAVHGVTETELNNYYKEAEKKIRDIMENPNPFITASLCGFTVIVLYVHMYFSVPWILWKHLVLDGIAFLTVPLLFVVFSDVIKNISDFTIYENRKSKYNFDYLTNDVRLNVWEERKYYEHVGSTHTRFVSVGYNVTESSTDENVEVQEGSIERPVPAAEDPRPEEQAEEPRPEAGEQEQAAESRPEAGEQEQAAEPRPEAGEQEQAAEPRPEAEEQEQAEERRPEAGVVQRRSTRNRVSRQLS